MPLGKIVHILRRLQVQKEIVSLINETLRSHGIETCICPDDITITDAMILDSDRAMPKLSGAIINRWWPSVPSRRVYHFTSKTSAERILNSGEFRLSCILGRINEHEIESFCESHDLTGYLEKDDKGVPTYRTLIAPNTFYASFAGSNIIKDQEECLWRRFASVDGVKITFEITAKNPDFRKVVYKSDSQQFIPVLVDLRAKLRHQFGKEFQFIGVSRMCSFYLPGEQYGVENEYRMLYRVWEGGIRQPCIEDGKPHIGLRLNEMNDIGFRLDIVDVQSSHRPNMPSCYPFTPRNAGA